MRRLLKRNNKFTPEAESAVPIGHINAGTPRPACRISGAQSRGAIFGPRKPASGVVGHPCCYFRNHASAAGHGEIVHAHWLTTGRWYDSGRGYDSRPADDPTIGTWDGHTHDDAATSLTSH